MMTLRETNRDAFYGLLSQNIEAFLPIIYTPTVGDACLQWSTLLRRPTGLYISSQDKVCSQLHGLLVTCWALSLGITQLAGWLAGWPLVVMTIVLTISTPELSMSLRCASTVGFKVPPFIFDTS